MKQLFKKYAPIALGIATALVAERVRIRGVCSQFKGLNIARNCCLVENGIRCPDGGSYPFPSERTIS